MEDYHEVIHAECGGVAMYAKNKKYYLGDKPTASDFKNLDGKIPNAGDQIACGNCKAFLMLIINDDGTISARRRIF